MNNKKETWTEFYERIKPKDGDRFTDDRGEDWIYIDDNCQHQFVQFRTQLSLKMSIRMMEILSCPLVPKDTSVYEPSKSVSIKAEPARKIVQLSLDRFGNLLALTSDGQIYMKDINDEWNEISGPQL